MRCTGCFKEVEEKEIVYATAVGRIERFDL